MGTSNPRQRGFTVVELLVVITIILLLVAIFVPSLKEAELRSQEAVCGADLRSLGQVCFIYAADNLGFYPDLMNERTRVLNGGNKRLEKIYWGWVNWRDYLMEEYKVKRSHFYSPTNPRWNRDDFWNWDPSWAYDDQRWVMGRYYFANSMANSDGFYNGMGHAYTTTPKPPSTTRPLFAQKTAGTYYFDLMWSDLNRQYPSSAENTFLTPNDPNRWGSNHMYPKKGGKIGELEPFGSHVIHLDGSLSWTPGDELDCWSVYSSVEYFW